VGEWPQYVRVHTSQCFLIYRCPQLILERLRGRMRHVPSIISLNVHTTLYNTNSAGGIVYGMRTEKLFSRCFHTCTFIEAGLTMARRIDSRNSCKLNNMLFHSCFLSITSAISSSNFHSENILQHKLSLIQIEILPYNTQAERISVYSYITIRVD